MERIILERKSFLSKAIKMSFRSAAEKRQVGAVIYDSVSKTIVGQGYNKMFDVYDQNRCENDAGKSYECVIHAEELAIMDMLKNPEFHKSTVRDLTIYVTYSPCMNCCKLIAHAGIKCVVYMEEHKHNFTEAKIENGVSPKRFLSDMGIETIQITKDEMQEQIAFDELQVIQRTSRMYRISEDPKIIPMDMCDTKPNKTALIYHSADPDGLMSGYLLNLAYKDQIKAGTAELIPYNYQEFAEWMIIDEFQKYVFVDVTPPIAWLMLDPDREIMIYDHHQYKMEEILKLKYSKIHYVFDVEKSGCLIFGDKIGESRVIKLDSYRNIHLIKQLCEYISDYDTWKIDLLEPRRKHQVLALAQYMFQIKTLDKFELLVNDIRLEKIKIDELVIIGDILINKQIEDNQASIKNGVYDPISNIFLFSGYPNYWIENQINNHLDLLVPNNTIKIKNWVGFNMKLDSNEIAFSVRGKDAIDLAKKYPNGGGHNEAAGFKLSLVDGLNFIKNFTSTAKYL